MKRKTYGERVSKYKATFPMFIPDKTSGVYFIESRKTGSTYIGCSVNVITRLFTHLNHLRKNTHTNIHLQRHYTKYGEDDLIVGHLELTDKYFEREKFWIDELDTYRHGFNRDLGGKGGATPETISAMTKGRDNDEYRAGAAERARRQMAELTKEEKSERAKKASVAAYKSFTSEELREKNKKASQARWAKPNARVDLSNKLRGTLSVVNKEEKTRRALQTWETRKAKQAKENV